MSREIVCNESITTGTTTGSYADALDWDVRLVRDKAIFLTNKHATYGLKYKLLVYMAHAGNSEDEVAETTLAGAGTVKFQYSKAYARMKVQVKTASGTDHATYQIDYIGKG